MKNRKHKRIKRIRKRNIIVSVVNVIIMVTIIAIGVKLSESEKKAPGFEGTLRVMGNDGTLPWVNREQ